MIIRWGRKGLLAGALAVTFVTPSTVTTSINEVQHRPSFKFEVRHITPVAAGTTSIKRAYVRPAFPSGLQFEHRFITPVSAAQLPVGGGGDAGIGKARRAYILRGQQIKKQERIDAIIRDDNEIIELVSMIVASGVIDEFD